MVMNNLGGIYLPVSSIQGRGIYKYGTLGTFYSIIIVIMPKNMIWYL